MINYKKGFTLIEILVVLAVITVIISFGMVVDSHVLNTDSFRAERSKIVTLLTKSRSRAMSGMYGSSHSFCYDSPDYILFSGRTACLPRAATDDIIPANPAVTISFSPATPVIFSRLSGNTEDGLTHTIHITDGAESADIIINYEGTIDW